MITSRAHDGRTGATHDRSDLRVGVRTQVRWLAERVRALIDKRTDGIVDDPYLGLYLSDERAREIAAPDASGSDGSRLPSITTYLAERADGRMRSVQEIFGLDDLDAAVLTIGTACDLEPRFEQLFGYLHDDLTRRRPSVGLAIELCGGALADPAMRNRFSSGSSLLHNGLIVIEEQQRPLLTRPIRTSDRVIAYLLGSDAADPEVERITIATFPVHTVETEQLRAALNAGIGPVHLHDEPSGPALGISAAAFASLGREAIAVDLALLYADDEPERAAAAALRDSALQDVGLIVCLDEDRRDAHRPAVERLARSGRPLVLIGSTPFDAPTGPPIHRIRVRTSAAETAAAQWRHVAPRATGDPDELRQFHLRVDHMLAAGALAELRASVDGRSATVDDFAAGARAQNSTRLEKLARRIEPAASWEDLILPGAVVRELRRFVERVSLRDVVHRGWKLGGPTGRRRGVVALFAGASGVGKTLAAEVLAKALRLDLYQVNLATVVDKYIGETEKNLERIFEAAEGVNGVVFFDEADALFGKRSEVSDAKDRYANVEVAYLLQRLETFGGVAVLATNLRSNVDEAFTRRLDSLIEFPEPDEAHRRALWDRCLGDAVPRAEDVDLLFLAERFRLSGGNIRNATVAAAFLAAAKRTAVGMSDLIEATAMEYRKLGRMCTPAEFGDWLELVDRDE